MMSRLRDYSFVLQNYYSNYFSCVGPETSSVKCVYLQVFWSDPKNQMIYEVDNVPICPASKSRHFMESNLEFKILKGISQSKLLASMWTGYPPFVDTFLCVHCKFTAYDCSVLHSAPVCALAMSHEREKMLLWNSGYFWHKSELKWEVICLTGLWKYSLFWVATLFRLSATVLVFKMWIFWWSGSVYVFT